LYNDEDIRRLCARALKTQGTEFQSAITELRVAFRYRVEDLSNYAWATLLKVGRAEDSNTNTN
jgi:hypothetical protein